MYPQEETWSASLQCCLQGDMGQVNGAVFHFLAEEVVSHGNVLRLVVCQGATSTNKEPVVSDACGRPSSNSLSED